MAKTCPTCNAELGGSAKKSSAWVPIITAVSVSAAALLVYKQVRKAKSDEQQVENALERCSRAASALDRRLGDSQMRIAG